MAHTARIPETRRPSRREIVALYSLLPRAAMHTSGSNYDMIASYAKGSVRLFGRNRIDRPAAQINDHYAEACGQHAEQDLIRKYDGLGGGTVLIAGQAARSKRFMANTAPCTFCVKTLDDAGVRHVVFFHDGSPRKASVRDFVNANLY